MIGRGVFHDRAAFHELNDRAAVSSDHPSTDPAQDLFGHAPFAKTLAKAIRNYRGSDGIVLALNGPWLFSLALQILRLFQLGGTVLIAARTSSVSRNLLG